MTVSCRRAILDISVIVASLLRIAPAGAQSAKPDASAKPNAGETQAPPAANDSASGSDPSAAAAADQTEPRESDEYADADPKALTEFKPYLDPHGTWVQDPTYGYVWIPNSTEVGEDFSPYVTDGHWALTSDNNWVWVSDYPFGWVVFHYGRWVWSENYGWVWIPGRKYADAWVVWRVPTASYAYVGWAPMPPSFVWWDGWAVSLWWYSPPVAYVFVPSYYVFSPRVYRYVITDRYRVRAVARYTAPYRVPATARPRAPSFQRARIPADAVPRTRTTADARALSAARRDLAVPYTPPPIRQAPRGATMGRRKLPAPSTQRPNAPSMTAPARRSPPAPSREERAPATRPAPVPTPDTRRYTPSGRTEAPRVHPAPATPPPLRAPATAPTRPPASAPSRRR